MVRIFQGGGSCYRFETEGISSLKAKQPQIDDDRQYVHNLSTENGQMMFVLLKIFLGVGISDVANDLCLLDNFVERCL